MKISKKILVVDDDPAILDVMKMVLKGAGYETHTSQNGSIFPQVIKSPPDLILLDVLLSGTDGRDIARKLKSEDKTRGIPLIMISAHPSAKDGSMKSGADKFLAKPFEIEELLAMVGDTLRGVPQKL